MIQIVPKAWKFGVVTVEVIIQQDIAKNYGTSIEQVGKQNSE